MGLLEGSTTPDRAKAPTPEPKPRRWEVRVDTSDGEFSTMTVDKEPEIETRVLPHLRIKDLDDGMVHVFNWGHVVKVSTEEIKN